MRTTLDLSEDAYQIAKTVARDQKRSLGSVVSDFITGQLVGASPASAEPTLEPGYFYRTFQSPRPTTNEDVRAAVDDEE